jgi:hypothetical protein
LKFPLFEVLFNDENLAYINVTCAHLGTSLLLVGIQMEEVQENFLLNRPQQY